MENNKSPGCDGLPSENFKYGGDDVCVPLLRRVLTKHGSKEHYRGVGNAIICPVIQESRGLEPEGVGSCPLRICRRGMF